MSLSAADQIAKAVLYEGYMLYPYRPSSVKNQQRFNFGVLYPEIYTEAQGGFEPSLMRAECLIEGNPAAIVTVKLRFLQLQDRSRTQTGPEKETAGVWQEAVEKEVNIPECSLAKLCNKAQGTLFVLEPSTDAAPDFTRRRSTIRGIVNLSAQLVGDNAFKLCIEVRNTTALAASQIASNLTRDEALMQSLVSAHLVLSLTGGTFVSLLETPPEFHHLAAQCQNAGWWPVLVGEPGQHDTLLVSPIILYDYPQVAAESEGDLFDSTEIDEILSLRIMTLTDEEKREIRESDERARQILERTDAMPPEQFIKLHGAVRSLRPLKEDIP
jgi:hypothetical protein